MEVERLGYCSIRGHLKEEAVVRTGKSKHFAPQHNQMRLMGQKSRPINQVKQCVTSTLLHLDGIKSEKAMNDLLRKNESKAEIGSIFIVCHSYNLLSSYLS